MKEDDWQLFHSGCVLLFHWVSVTSQSEKELDAVCNRHSLAVC